MSRLALKYNNFLLKEKKYTLGIKELYLKFSDCRVKWKGRINNKFLLVKNIVFVIFLLFWTEKKEKTLSLSLFLSLFL